MRNKHHIFFYKILIHGLPGNLGELSIPILGQLSLTQACLPSSLLNTNNCSNFIHILISISLSKVCSCFSYFTIQFFLIVSSSVTKTIFYIFISTYYNLIYILQLQVDLSLNDIHLEKKPRHPSQYSYFCLVILFLAYS